MQHPGYSNYYLMNSTGTMAVPDNHYDNHHDIALPANAMYDSYHFVSNQRPRTYRDWSERILEDIHGLVHVLSMSGSILYCSESCLDMTGYQSQEVIGRSLIEFLHMDDRDAFMSHFSLACTSLTRMKTYFRWRKKDNTYLLLESIGQPKQNYDQFSFIAIAQPCSSKTKNLYDTCLELRTENTWLKERLKYLLSQEQEPSHPLPIMSNPTPVIDEMDTLDKGWVTPSSSCDIHDFLNTLQPDSVFGPFYPSSNSSSSSSGDPWKRRKKYREHRHYVCRDCGTTASPEWRKGPIGPKTLCNACGLRWAKKNKKKDFKMN